MRIKRIAEESKRKGIELVATGDCLHSKWLEEINQCKQIDDGTLELDGTRFIYGTEVEDSNRVHHLLFFPAYSSLIEFKEKIKSYSINLESDGRPNLRLDGEQIAELAKDIEVLIGPAHSFTPWTALYAYHDSLKSCYGELTPYISFIELGLSADSDYADRISELSRVTFLTNSDAHSPHPVRLAREFNRFEVEDATFEEVKKALLREGGRRCILNVGLPPQEGKYNESACIACHRHFSLREAILRKWRCGCGGKIKKGVKDRVSEIANQPISIHPSYRPPYLHIIPLAEIIAAALEQSSPFTKRVTDEWLTLIKSFGNEVKVLVDARIEDITKVAAPAVVKAIQAFREDKVTIHPGGGGEYGRIELAYPAEVEVKPEERQKSIFDYVI
jgi:uncharacterized protein (TIGR00375 family)